MRRTAPHPWINATIQELAHFGRALGALGCVPGNGGDVSVLIPPDVSSSLATKESIFVRFTDLDQLRALRGDARPYYRAQGTTFSNLDLPLDRLVGRMILTTTSGAKMWDLDRAPQRHFCIITVQEKGFHLHATAQQPVPTTEVINHLIGHALNTVAENTSSTVLHAHPQHSIDLSRHPAAGTCDDFNYQVYTQRVEQLANVPELLGFVPFALPGSTTLATATASAFVRHRVVIWQAHGVIVREQSMERCVDLVQYTEASAAAALRCLTAGELRRPSRDEIALFLSMYELPEDFLQLLDRRERP